MNEPLDRPGFGDNVVPLTEHRGADSARSREAAPTVANVEVEQALIGCVLHQPHVLPTVETLVSAEHFAEEAHRILWETIVRVAAAGDTPNGLKVMSALGQALRDQDFGGRPLAAYVARLVAGGGLPINAVEYARTVQQYWQLRELAAATAPLTNGDGFVPGPMLEALYARVDQVRASFVERKVTSASLGDANDELMRDIQAGLQGQDRPLPSSGIVALDEEIGGGLLPSFLLTLGARTSVGKSIVGVEIARQVSKGGHAAIYHSLEMSRKQVSARVASSHLHDRGEHIPFSQIIKRRGLNEREAHALAYSNQDTRGLPLHIEDGGGRTIGDIAAATDRLANSYARRNIPLGVVVIDHAHIVRFSRAFKREDEGFKEIADGALALAKHLDTTVLLLAQLNRGPEGREDKRPGLADLRGAGAFEEDSDAVVFLYRPAYYIERSTAFRNGDPAAQQEHQACKHLLEFIIDKNRAGQSNHIVRAWVDPALNAVRNLQHGPSYA